MKVKDLTSEQVDRIEKYEVGRDLIQNLEWKEMFHHNECHIRIEYLSQEIKRTIKRIEDEIEFLQNLNETNSLVPKHGIDQVLKKIALRVKKLKQELEDYKLMESLE